MRNVFRSLNIIALLILVTAVISCDDNNNENNTQALTEIDFANDPSLRADGNSDVVVDLLEPPNSGVSENDTGTVGEDIIPINYSVTQSQTICWEDDDAQAMHMMELRDAGGNEVLTVEVNTGCVTQVIEAGDYVMAFMHDGRSNDTLPIFITPDLDDEELARETSGFFNRLMKAVPGLLNNFYNNIYSEAKAQTNRETLIRTNMCPMCNLRGANLNDADLRGVILTGANLIEARLNRADLTEADLSDAILRRAIMLKVIMEDADLSGVDMNPLIIECNRPGCQEDPVLEEETVLQDANLRGANLSDAEMRRAFIDGADFTGADLSRADMSGTSLFETIFVDATLVETNFGGADLEFADLSGANMFRAFFPLAFLDGANLNGADMTETDLIQSNITDANMSNVNLTGSKLNSANLTGTDLSLSIWCDGMCECASGSIGSCVGCASQDICF